LSPLHAAAAGLSVIDIICLEQQSVAESSTNAFVGA